jgi:glycosyltransferase involved in cell wall biosynthesis
MPNWRHHVRHPLRFRLVVARKVLLSRPLRRLLRTWALRRPEASDAVTVVIVSWNSLRFLPTVLDATRRFSPPQTQIIVVDNASTDGSRDYLRRRPDVRRVLLPVNIYHGPAMDLGFLLASTEYVVSLDVDAFPLSDRWLDRLLEPLRDGYAVSGARVHRSYAHPSCAAMRRRRFAERDHTFRGNMSAATLTPDDLGDGHWDTGELISLREQPDVFLFERTTQLRPGRGVLGLVYDDLVYHNAYGTRHRENFGESGEGALDEEEIRLDEVNACWDLAVERYLGGR